MRPEAVQPEGPYTHYMLRGPSKNMKRGCARAKKKYRLEDDQGSLLKMPLQFVVRNLKPEGESLK